VVTQLSFDDPLNGSTSFPESPEFINQKELDRTALVDQAIDSFPARPKNDQRTALEKGKVW
jgi:hypothetical protein